MAIKQCGSKQQWVHSQALFILTNMGVGCATRSLFCLILTLSQRKVYTSNLGITDLVIIETTPYLHIYHIKSYHEQPEPSADTSSKDHAH